MTQTTIFGGQVGSETLRAGEAITITVVVGSGCVMERFSSGQRVQTLPISSTTTLGPYAADQVFRVSAYAGSTVVLDTSAIPTDLKSSASGDGSATLGANNFSGNQTIAGRVFVSDRVGVQTVAPIAPLDVSTNNPAMALPAASGTTNTAVLRIGYASYSWDGVQLDMGVYNNAPAEYPAWIQARNPTNYGVNRPLWLNPNGGEVKVGSQTYLRSGQIAVGRSPLGIMGTFEGSATNGSNLDGVIVTTNTAATSSGYYDVFGISSQITAQTIPAGIVDSGIRVGITGDAYSNSTAFAGTLGTQVGVRGRAGFAVSGGTAGAVVNNAYGGRFTVINATAGVTIQNAAGVYVEALGTSGNIINHYDIYASTAAAKNYFAGKVGVGTTNPTASISIQAGTATQAPLQMAAGALLTTPANGTFEFDGTNLYFSIGGVRKTVSLV